MSEVVFFDKVDVITKCLTLVGTGAQSIAGPTQNEGSTYEGVSGSGGVGTTGEKDILDIS